MKMNIIAEVGYPTEEKDCLCKDKNDNYVVARPHIIENCFSDWFYTEELVEENDIISWIYIDDLNLE